jgi:hypothetical protein
MNDTITTKNKMTGEKETINQYDIEIVGWGFHFFVDSELDAFKAAYQYRNAPHGVIVEFAGGVQKWMVTVFNETAKASGIDGAK